MHNLLKPWKVMYTDLMYFPKTPTSGGLNNTLYPTQPCILGNSHGVTVIFTRKYH